MGGFEWSSSVFGPFGLRGPFELRGQWRELVIQPPDPAVGGGGHAAGFAARPPRLAPCGSARIVAHQPVSRFDQGGTRRVVARPDQSGVGLLQFTRSVVGCPSAEPGRLLA